MEKARRKAESDLKMTIDNLNEMERSKLDLEEVVKKYVLFIRSVRHNCSNRWSCLEGARSQSLYGGPHIHSCMSQAPARHGRYAER